MSSYGNTHSILEKLVARGVLLSRDFISPNLRAQPSTYNELHYIIHLDSRYTNDDNIANLVLGVIQSHFLSNFPKQKIRVEVTDKQAMTYLDKDGAKNECWLFFVVEKA
jgi:hypothetical protein